MVDELLCNCSPSKVNSYITSFRLATCISRLVGQYVAEGVSYNHSTGADTVGHHKRITPSLLLVEGHTYAHTCMHAHTHTRKTVSMILEQAVQW